MGVIFDPKDGGLRYRGHYVSAEVIAKAELVDVLHTIDQVEDARESLGDYDD